MRKLRHRLTTPDADSAPVREKLPAAIRPDINKVIRQLILSKLKQLLEKATDKLVNANLTECSLDNHVGPTLTDLYQHILEDTLKRPIIIVGYKISDNKYRLTIYTDNKPYTIYTKLTDNLEQINKNLYYNVIVPYITGSAKP